MPVSQAVILPPTSESAERLAELHAPCFPHDPWDAKTFQTLLNLPGALAILEHEGRGLFMSYGVRPQAEMLTLGILPAHQRQGLARSLMAEALTALRHQGMETLFLEVATDNPAAIALYQNLGFEQTGRRAQYYTPKNLPPVDALIFQRNLQKSSA